MFCSKPTSYSARSLTTLTRRNPVAFTSNSLSKGSPTFLTPSWILSSPRSEVSSSESLTIRLKAWITYLRLLSKTAWNRLPLRQSMRNIKSTRSSTQHSPMPSCSLKLALLLKSLSKLKAGSSYYLISTCVKSANGRTHALLLILPV